jgi:drug/metabolite transporter (DMT)-like permease
MEHLFPMSVGYWFMLAALFSFGAMGIVHKMGDRRACNPLHIALFTMATASVLSVIYLVVAHRTSLNSWKTAVPLIALPFGACAAAALWLFQRGLRYGRIATSWLLINLSAAIPTVLSVVVYREPMKPRKVSILLLVVASLVLLWWDRRQDQAKGEELAIKNTSNAVHEVK